MTGFKGALRCGSVPAAAISRHIPRIVGDREAGAPLLEENPAARRFSYAFSLSVAFSEALRLRRTLLLPLLGTRVRRKRAAAPSPTARYSLGQNH